MEKMIANTEFREDLYYRLNVFTIFVPRCATQAGPAAALDHFLEKFSRENGKSIKRISTPAIDMLTSYHWPGNVRELENCLERAVLVCDGHVIHAHHRRPRSRPPKRRARSCVSRSRMPWPRTRRISFRTR